MSRTIYYIDLEREKRNTAGAKAPDDISKFCMLRGYNRFIIPNFPVEKSKIYKKAWLLFTCTGWWKKLEKTVKDGDIVIYQHPMYGKRIASHMIRDIQKRKKCKFIAIIHDLESLRGGIEGVIKENEKTSIYGDNELLKCFDAIICHNEYMKKYLVNNGIEATRIVNLEIFDYISDFCREKSQKESVPTIIIAGNLALGKCAYIYDICNGEYNKDLIVNLYGNNFEKDKNMNFQLKWRGSYKPDELPLYLEGDFGLVWDGSSADTCAGNTGKYLRYNNPHKTSLYLATGIPVIVWKQSAIADFVVKNKVGIAVDNLHNLDNIISEIDKTTYYELCENAKKISLKLRKGHFFYSALDKALEVVE